MSLQLKSSIISSIYFFILLNNWISLHQLVKCEINNNAVEKEQILTSKLLANYNKRLRPSRTVQVKFALNLNQIIKLVEKDQIFMLNVFIDHEWIDGRLSWNPYEYGNLTAIRISSEYLWTPDTFVYTTADQTGFLLPQMGAYFIVDYKGSIFWPNPLTQMRVRCRMSIAWFPFDDQLCVIVFGSWSYTHTYLNYSLLNEFPSLENYTENNEWSLVSYKPVREEIKYDNWIEDDFFSEIRYKILIKRKPLFVLQNFVIPALMLCIITLVTFFVPFAQEMQLGISIMLAFSVFKLRLSDDVPVQSDSIPLINIYFTLCMSFSLSAMIWFSLMNIYKENKKVPSLVRMLVLKYICFIMCEKNFKKDYPCCDENKKSAINNMIKEKKKTQKPASGAWSAGEKKLVNKNQEAEIWVPQIKEPIYGDQFSKNDQDKSAHENSVKLRIVLSESYLSFDKLRNKSENSPILSPKLNLNKSTPEFPRKKLSSKELEALNNHPVSTRSYSSLKPDQSERVELTDLEVLGILNKFVFTLFLLFIIGLNVFSLIVYPYLFKKPLAIDDEFV